MSMVGSGLVRVYMCFQPSFLDRGLTGRSRLFYCTCTMYVPAASSLCLFEKPAALADGPNGWRPGNPNMQALKLIDLQHALYVRCSCSSSLSCICHLPIRPSSSLVRDPPQSHSLPTPAQSTEPTSPVHLTACRGSTGSFTRQKGAQLVSVCEPYV